MNWLRFFIGLSLGWLVGWLIDFLVCRPRREAASADLRLSLEDARRESTSLNAQLAAYDGQYIGGDAGVKLLRPVESRDNVGLEKVLHCFEQFTVRRSVLHRRAPAALG